VKAGVLVRVLNFPAFGDMAYVRVRLTVMEGETSMVTLTDINSISEERGVFWCRNVQEIARFAGEGWQAFSVLLHLVGGVVTGEEPVKIGRHDSCAR